jgi:hypothetical protein
VEGTVTIKRKAFWVKRYAKVENFIFTYKKDKSKTASFENIADSIITR